MGFRKLRQYYNKQTKNSCISIGDFKDFKQIILIRHGEPDLAKEGLFSKENALIFKKAYKTAAIKKIEKNPFCIDSLPAMVIFHSSLRRAEHTAELLFNSEKFSLRGADYFVEFDRQPIEFLDIKMPIRWWNFLSRFLWFLGINQKEYESVPQALKRVKRGASELMDYSSEKGVAILVAHGIYNKFMGFELYRRSWSKVYDEGGGYLGIKIFAKKMERHSRATS